VRSYSELAKPIYEVVRAAERKVDRKMTPKQRARMLGRT